MYVSILSVVNTPPTYLANSDYKGFYVHVHIALYFFSRHCFLSSHQTEGDCGFVYSSPPNECPTLEKGFNADWRKTWSDHILILQEGDKDIQRHIMRIKKTPWLKKTNMQTILRITQHRHLKTKQHVPNEKLIWSQIIRSSSTCGICTRRVAHIIANQEISVIWSVTFGKRVWDCSYDIRNITVIICETDIS